MSGTVAGRAAMDAGHAANAPGQVDKVDKRVRVHNVRAPHVTNRGHKTTDSSQLLDQGPDPGQSSVLYQRETVPGIRAVTTQLSRSISQLSSSEHEVSD